MKLNLSFWTNASSKRKRIYSIIIIFILAVIVTVIGSYIPISHQYAQTVYNEVPNLNNTSIARGTELIFVNNFSICLLMFVPIIGPIIGFIILGNTGVALGAISYVKGYPVWIALLSTVLTPVFWLEFTAYSTAIAGSIWLTRRLIQGRWRELKNTAILIGICAAILIISAIIEAWLIAVLG